MAGPKPAALPLGDTPMVILDWNYIKKIFLCQYF
jgi:hypothetical protein